MLLGSLSGRLRSSRVCGVVLGQKPLLLVLSREHEEHEGRTQNNRYQPGGVRPLIALQERRLGGCRDLVCVLRVLLGDGLGPGE